MELLLLGLGALITIAFPVALHALEAHDGRRRT